MIQSKEHSQRFPYQWLMVIENISASSGCSGCSLFRPFLLVIQSKEHSRRFRYPPYFRQALLFPHCCLHPFKFLLAATMGHSPCDEQATLIPRQAPLTPLTPLKFPLGLVSEGVRPYLELIRLEKVSFTCRRHCILPAHYFIMCSPPERSLCFGLLVRYSRCCSLYHA